MIREVCNSIPGIKELVAPPAVRDAPGATDDLFTKLRDIERRLDTTQTGSRRYVFHSGGGEWFVRVPLIWQALSTRPFRTSLIPALSGVRRKVQLSKQALRGALHDLPTSADIVNVRPHYARTRIVRAFYCARNGSVSLKTAIAPVSAQQRACIRGEVENIARVREIGCLTVPKAITHDCHSASPYFVEEFLDGWTVSGAGDARRLERQLVPAMEAHWERFGVSFRTPAEFYGETAIDGLNRSMDAVRWQSTWASKSTIRAAVEQIVRSGGTMALSFCHGDINASHIAMSGGRDPALIDWEGATVLPMAVDLTDVDRVACRFVAGGTFDVSIKSLERLCVPRCSDALRGDEQLLIGALAKGLRYFELRSRYEQEGRTKAFVHDVYRYVFSQATRVLSQMGRMH